jgi:hypothetical protein
MRDDGEVKGRRQSAKGTRDVRQERLKLALRENLKRRKSQARARNEFNILSSNSDDVVAGDTAKKHPGK